MKTHNIRSSDQLSAALWPHFLFHVCKRDMVAVSVTNLVRNEFLKTLANQPFLEDIVES